MRRSAISRLSTSSLLPVPLNSSKITWSILLPVSISAVAMIVSEPEPPLRVDLARAAEKALRGLERLRVEAAGQRASGAALGGVEGPGQPGDGIEDDDRIATLLDPAACALHRELREGHMALGGMVEAGGDDLAHPRHLHLAHFLGPFVHQQDEELGVRVVVRDAGGNGLQHGGLAGLGGSDDQRALAEAERGDEVDEATGHVALPARCLGAFELEHPARMHRGEPVEVGAAPGLLGGTPVDGGELPEQRRLAAIGGEHLARKFVAGSQAELAHGALVHAHVVALRIPRHALPAQGTLAPVEFEDAEAFGCCLICSGAQFFSLGRGCAGG